MTTTIVADIATEQSTWTIHDVAAYLRIPVGTLYQWRHRRTGPPAVKVGRHLRYDPDHVRAWCQERET